MSGPSLPRLELICLGPPSARLDGREPPAEVLWRRHLALLVYLALSPERTRTRDHLVGLLWPEKPDDKARHALNESLRRLRHSLGAERLESREDAIVLNDQALEVDALQLDAIAERDPGRAVALLRGDFLEGFLLDEAPAFDEWVSSERTRRRARAVALLVSHGDSRLAAGRYPEASDAARRALALDPHAEPAARLLMRAAALFGDAAGALVAYQTFITALKEDVGEEPSRDLAALAERIRAQRVRPVATRSSEPEAPFVGRAAVRADGFDVVSASLESGPRALLVTGAPGMGRTRLLAECAGRLTLEGATVALARPLESDHDAPWSTLRLLMRAGLDRAPGLVGAPADALAVLSDLDRGRHDAARVASALAAALGAAADEGPVGIVIDDAHLSDGATLEALHAGLEQMSTARVILILSATDVGTGPRALVQLRSAIGRERGLRGSSLRLGPLTEADVREIVTVLAPWCHSDTDRDRLARRLAFETGGNPFFVTTLLGGLRRLATLREDLLAWPKPEATYDSPLPISVPDLARVAIAARVAELDADSRRVLSAASIGGRALDLDLVATLCGLPRSDVEDRLAAAERLHLVAFDGERYVFVAPLIGDVVRGECLTPGQRKAMRQRAVAALAARTDLDARVLSAELMAAAEPGSPAFEAAASVVKAALDAGSVRTARRALAAADRAGRVDETFRPELDALRAQVDARSA